MRSAVTAVAFTVTEVPLELEPVTADPFIDTLERQEASAQGRLVTIVASSCSSRSRSSTPTGPTYAITEVPSATGR
jgi:hypothetical protein